MIPFRPLAWVFNLLLAGAVSFASAALSMQVLERSLNADLSVPVAAAPQQQEQAALAKLALSEFAPVLSANIFNARRSEVKPTVTAGSDKPAPPLKVPLLVTLTGTMIMGERSFAMVADGNGRNERLYRLWDCLPAAEKHPTRNCAPTQGKLINVRKTRILVRYQGEQLAFELAEKPKAPGAAAAALAPIRRAAPAPGLAQTPAQEGSNAPFPMTQQGNVLQVRVPNAEVGKAFENFSDVLKEARVVPYTDETGQGFQIRNIRPGSIFDRIGLSNFDKIKSVNGDPITTADQALRLLTMFRNEREITLELERKDQSLQLNYIID